MRVPPSPRAKPKAKRCSFCSSAIPSVILSEVEGSPRSDVPSFLSLNPRIYSDQRTTRASAAGQSGLEFHTESPLDPTSIEILRAWPDTAIHNGFVGRSGGVSREQFSSLNLSYFVGDDRANVDSNWERLRREVPVLKTVARMNQVHGNEVHVITRKTASNRPRGDGIVTAESGVILGIFSADCVPILMIDLKQKIAGAFHAGWRGILADIATVGVNAMIQLGAHPSDLCTALGPSIGPCCFEVDQDLADRFDTELQVDHAEHRNSAPLSPLYVSQVPINPRPLAGEGTASAPGVRVLLSKREGGSWG